MVNEIMNKEIETEKMLENIKKLDIIIDLIGPINDKFTTFQKLQFAALAHETGIYYQLADIYGFITMRPVKREMVQFIKFLENLGFKKTCTNKSKIIQNNYKAKYGASWLMMYDIEQDFKASLSGELPLRKILVDDCDEPVVIDKQIAKEIITILKENEIITINCIVWEAFRKYAVGQLETFINEFVNTYSINQDVEERENQKVKVL